MRVVPIGYVLHPLHAAREGATRTRDTMMNSMRYKHARIDNVKESIVHVRECEMRAMVATGAHIDVLTRISDPLHAKFYGKEQCEL